MPKKPSLLGIFTNPTEQFDRIRERPIIWGAMGIIVLLFIIGIGLSIVGVDLTELMTDSELELELDEDLQSIVKWLGIITFFIVGIIGPIAGVLISSIVHLLVAKIAQSTVTFRHLFSMNTYIMIVTVAGMILNGLLIAVFGGEMDVLYTSLGSLIDLEGAGGVLVDRLEIFAIWKIILTAIGLERVARFPKGLAWSVPIIIFLVGILFGIMGASVPV